MILTISQQYAKPLTAQCKAKHCGCVHLIAQCTVPSSPETHSAVPLALVGVLDIHVVARAMFGAEAENNRSVGHKAGFKMRRKRTTYHGWKEETERARQERNKLGNTPRTPNETQPKHLPFQPAGGMREREFDFAAPRWIANGQARNQCEVTDTPPGAEKHTSALPTCALSSRARSAVAAFPPTPCHPPTHLSAPVSRAASVEEVDKGRGQKARGGGGRYTKRK
eukprot:476573-Rhodomonas_salina.1